MDDIDPVFLKKVTGGLFHILVTLLLIYLFLCHLKDL